AGWFGQQRRGALLHDDQATGHLQLLHFAGWGDAGAALRPGARVLRRRPAVRTGHAGMGDHVTPGRSLALSRFPAATRAGVLLGGALAAGVMVGLPARAHDPSADPAKTESWTPVPPPVATPAGAAPSDAVVLFDGSGLSAWESEVG